MAWVMRSPSCSRWVRRLAFGSTKVWRSSSSSRADSAMLSAAASNRSKRLVARKQSQQAAHQPGEQNRACSRRGTDEGSYADTSPYGPLDNRGGPDSPILPATPPDPTTGSGGDLTVALSTEADISADRSSQGRGAPRWPRLRRPLLPPPDHRGESRPSAPGKRRRHCPDQ